MLKYYKQEMRDLRDPESGRVREVYKVLLDQSVTAEGFMSYMTKHSMFTESMTTAACVDIANFLGELLARNGSVTLPGIGTFSVGIRAKKGKRKGFIDKTVEMTATGMPVAADQSADDSTEETSSEVSDDVDAHDINARSIELSHINFRASKELFNDVDSRIRRDGGFHRARYYGFVPLYTPDITHRLERFAAAREYLQTHPYLRIADYASLTGLSYTTAQRELKLAGTLTDSGLLPSGRGSHRVYILRRDIPPTP